MDAARTGQVTKSAADIYEDFFVPALFAQWAPRLAQAAGLGPGQKVLDVACGTGVLARAAADLVRPGGVVIGLDRNQGMLDVARRLSDDGDWRLGKAEALPFDDGEFDAVVSQFGLMFFDDGAEALSEMWRVLRPGGRIAAAVWDEAENSPGYAAMIALLEELFGDSVASALRAPFTLGDRERLLSLFGRAGIESPQLETRDGAARFPSIESWVHTDVKGWTLADLIDGAQYRMLLDAAGKELRQFVREDGSVEFAAPAHIVTARKL